MEKASAIKLMLLTPVYILLCHDLAVLPHLYGHILTAWWLGFHSESFSLHVLRPDILSKLFLFDTRAHIGYQTMVAGGGYYNVKMAIVALSGPIIVNGALYLLSLWLLTFAIIRKNRYFFYFVLWFNFANLGVLFSYVPTRIFSSIGDMSYVVKGLAVSPWFLYVIFGYLMAFFIWQFFTNTLIQTYIILEMNEIWQKVALMIVCTLILFAGYGTAGFLDSGDISRFLSVSSLILIPGWMIACWPTRKWVKRQMALPRLSDGTHHRG